MKVENLNYSQAYKSKHGSVYDLRERNMHAVFCTDESKKLNRGYYSGSFTGKEKAAAKLSDRLLQKLINGCNDQATIIQNFWALALAVLPRPIAIMLLPDPKRKNQKDKIAAACHGIASGLVGFAFASAIMYPIGIANLKVKGDERKAKYQNADGKIIAERIAKITQEELDAGKNVTEEELLKDTKIVSRKFLELFGEFEDGRLVKINKLLNFDRLSKTITMGPDTLVFGVAKAALTIALIPPIMKYLFPDKNPPKTEPATAEGGQK